MNILLCIVVKNVCGCDDFDKIILRTNSFHNFVSTIYEYIKTNFIGHTIIFDKLKNSIEKLISKPNINKFDRYINCSDKNTLFDGCIKFFSTDDIENNSNDNFTLRFIKINSYDISLFATKIDLTYMWNNAYSHNEKSICELSVSKIDKYDVNDIDLSDSLKECIDYPDNILRKFPKKIKNDINVSFTEIDLDYDYKIFMGYESVGPGSFFVNYNYNKKHSIFHILQCKYDLNKSRFYNTDIIIFFN